jgi:hypothetical protein
VALAVLAAAIAGGGIAALVDAFDRFDPESAAVVSPDRAESPMWLGQVLWVRGETGSVEAALDPGPAIERAVKAFNLILQAGGFAVAALDVADAPSAALRRLPFTTWFRLARAVEGGRTAALILAADHLARSPGGVTIALDADPHWAGSSPRARILESLRVRPRMASSSLAAASQCGERRPGPQATPTRRENRCCNDHRERASGDRRGGGAPTQRNKCLPVS